MPPTHQWIHTTTGRTTLDPHSWMTAVHWTSTQAAKGHYRPTAKGSPKWGATTVALAQEIAALKECRPGIDYLARKLKVSVRTVKYHLGMLRETGLLVYRSKGTRIRGAGNQASVYERAIPAAFDTALGIRTVGEGVQRRPVGAAPEHRTLLGKLAKKAARKVRRTRRKTPVSGGTRCTPMEGGTSSSSSAAGTYSPSESKLASGQASSPTPKKPKRGPRTLNKVGRRYQLARQAITTIPWLHRASAPRIAWVLKDFADAGWTVREVQAVAESIPMPAYGVKRPSGMLADRLRGKASLSKKMRAGHVVMWEESRAAAKDRHDEVTDLGPGPRSLAARRAIDEAFAAIRDRLAPEMPEVELSPLGSIDDLTRQEVLDLRDEAAKNPDVVLDMIRALGERDARRLYTNRIVDQTLALERINARRDTYAPAF
ncbi:helix-turn-helix domain-containing protein [Streptomyces olivaceus]|uniref:helix-turn-helix domain-containing protein n=1 Tax=Streptomyces olivaceus TaxID=47716 RepID=UPI001CCCBDCF|nr:helix-turn-helix domain-containing protein [Streptomyces olivaceus]MBZ6211590.1 helix-turn-helix domain-containing protein [Streptomyces olivaceus]